MNAFEWVTPKDLKGAVAALRGDKAKALAGGMDLLCEMKEGLVEPSHVVNLKSIAGLNEVSGRDDLRIGALVTLAELADSERVRSQYRAVADAALSVGSPQIRNVGTVGGNLCQRPRCWYYRDAGIECLKKGGDECYAENGENEYHAILGGGPCHIVHPSDLAPALIAMDAKVEIQGTSSRSLPLLEFFVLPAVNWGKENVLERGEIVTAVTLPKSTAGWKSAYYKFRERESFDWALASAAVALRMSGDTVQESRIVLGGVAPVPWRSKEAEAALNGKSLSQAVAETAGKAAVRGAKPLKHNGYKVRLAANVVRIALLRAAGLEEA